MRFPPSLVLVAVGSLLIVGCAPADEQTTPSNPTSAPSPMPKVPDPKPPSKKKKKQNDDPCLGVGHLIAGATGEVMSAVGPGDLNGDGFDDLVVGLLSDKPSGAAYVLHGPLQGRIDTSQSDLTIEGVGPHLAGLTVASIGDNNNDGVPDFAIGAGMIDMAGTNSPSRAWVFHGSKATGTISVDDAAATLIGAAPSDQTTARSLATAGDLDGDGTDDLLVGSLIESLDATRLHVGYGPLSGTIVVGDLTTRIEGAVDFEDVGAANAFADDLTGDGAPDLLTNFRPDFQSGSRVGVFEMPTMGQTSTTAAATAVIFPPAGVRFMGGQQGLSSGGDVTGDGDHDVLIASNEYTNTDGQIGGVFVFAGPLTGDYALDKDATAVILGLAGQKESCCRAASIVGDLNGDGVDDVVVGSENDDQGGYDTGAVYVFYGPLAASQTLADADVTLPGDGPEDYAGEYVRPAGDVDADGLDDFVVNADAVNLEKYDAGGGACLIYGKDL